MATRASLVLLLSILLPSLAGPGTEALLQPGDFVYLGAFKLPGAYNRPRTFAYGGNAMTFNPAGDPSGPNDGFPGSLFITGHDRLPYGELPNGDQVAEVSIPRPVISKRLPQLKRAKFLQNFQETAVDYFHQFEEIPRVAMQYLDTEATGPKIHLGWGQHLEPNTPGPTHAWFSPDLKTPEMRGAWYIGRQSFYSVNGYMFEIPAAWAKRYAKGRVLATGRFKDGGWSGMGPELFAYRPWSDNAGTPPLPGTRLTETVLLKYQNSMNSNSIARCLKGYQHPDEWEGGAWVGTTTGKSAVLFAGTKSTGTKYWYGFQNPSGPDVPCVAQDFVGQFPVCRTAGGGLCPETDLTECSGHNDYRGWWSTSFEGRIILYNPSDLARVATKKLASWKPQPYAHVNFNDYLLLNPGKVEQDMLGWVAQRRYRIGDVAYDRAHDLLYVLELFAERSKPVVHVFRLRR